MVYAGWPRRVAGYFVDVVACYVPWGLLPVVDPLLPLDAGRRTLLGDAVVIALFGAPFVILFYNRWARGGLVGTTWGRALVGIRLVDESTGKPIGMGRAFARDVAHLFDTLPLYLGWFRPLWNPRRQTFADTAARSVVVRT